MPDQCLDLWRLLFKFQKLDEKMIRSGIEPDLSELQFRH